MKRALRLALAVLCVLITWPALASQTPEALTSPVTTTRPSHGRPQQREDGRLGGAGRAQAEGRARNRVGIEGDGNVPLHEWVERDADAVDEDFTRPANEEDVVAAGEKALKAMLSGRPANGPPEHTASEASLAQASAEGTVDAPITWLFEPETFAPLAKLVGGQRFGIVTDHLGTPRAMFDANGAEVWGADIDAYGDLRNQRGQRQACPFRWPGQYEDAETGLYYNRFRYYDAQAGNYLSLDPIGILGGFNVTAYVVDPNSWIDPFGLAGRINNQGLFAKSNEYGRGSGSGVVTIPYQGSRSRDFTLADKEFASANNGRARPEGYTWHHANYDPATGMGEMQLVKTDVHAATSHAGGVAEFKEAHGLGYDNDAAIKLVEDRGLLKGRSPCK